MTTLHRYTTTAGILFQKAAIHHKVVELEQKHLNRKDSERYGCDNCPALRELRRAQGVAVYFKQMGGRGGGGAGGDLINGRQIHEYPSRKSTVLPTRGDSSTGQA